MRMRRKSTVSMLMGLVVTLILAVVGSGGTEMVANAVGAPASSHAAKAHAKKKAHKKKKPSKHKKKLKCKAGYVKKNGKCVKRAAKPPTTAANTVPQKLGEGPKVPGGTTAVENATEIPAAPAWTEPQLNAYPSGNWITPDGGTTGDHYSQLEEISTSNVSQLKSDWMIQLDGSCILVKCSGEATPTEYDGVLYYSTGADDVFAVSVKSGKILWVHKGEQPETVKPCCGWDNRGVTIGEGMVFTATLLGDLQALNQKTGELVWKTELGEASEGISVTSDPLYYNGMLFIGPVGADFGIRGYMAAYSAKTGELLWKHYNVPAPGEYGHNTWPAGTGCVECNNDWEVGGASVWNAPTVDPKAGLIYYSTANAYPDDYGGERPGENLWTASMLALNYKTGKMAWGFQQVHHDIWDFDSANPTAAVEVEINGKMVQGVLEANKDGWVYFVNAATGEPVFPIEEKAVPQNSADQTYPTQPVPTMPPFMPLKTSPEAVAEIQAAAAKLAGEKHLPTPTVVHGGLNEEDVFAPYPIVPPGGTLPATLPLEFFHGAIYPTDSFDPKNGYFYVCAARYVTSAEAFTAEHQEGEPGATHNGKSYFSASAAAGKAPGYIDAYNLHTGQMAWQHTLPEKCVSGNTTTAGNILFTGVNEYEPGKHDEIQALNATTGEELWHYELGAGVDASAAVFEFEGKEYVAIYAGGNELAKYPTGDNLWEFSLNGSGQQGPIAPGQTPAPPPLP